MCCSSSRSASGRSWPSGSRPSPIRHGLPSRPETPRWTSTIEGRPPSSSCATMTPSSPVASTRCSAARDEGHPDSDPGAWRPRQTPSGGCRPRGPSVLTGRWCSADGIYCESCVPTSVTTTCSDPTAAWHWAFLTRWNTRPGLDARPARDVERRDVLGGLVREYHAVAACQGPLRSPRERS
jgi:hypothetical protein